MKDYVSIIDVLSLCNAGFVSDVLKIRSKTLSLPIETDPTIDTILKIDKKLLSDKYFALKYNAKVKKLCRKYKIIGLEDEIKIYIESNINICRYNGRAQKHSFEFFQYKSQNNENIHFMQNYFPSFSLIIKHKINAEELDQIYNDFVKKEILKRCDEHFGKIYDHYIYAPTFNQVREIFRLKQMDKSFKFIAEYINENFKNDKNVLSDKGKITADSVKSKYTYYLKTFGKSPPVKVKDRNP